jgi:hypothetical protein
MNIVTSWKGCITNILERTHIHTSCKGCTV